MHRMSNIMKPFMHFHAQRQQSSLSREVIYVTALQKIDRLQGNNENTSESELAAHKHPREAGSCSVAELMQRNGQSGREDPMPVDRKLKQL